MIEMRESLILEILTPLLAGNVMMLTFEREDTYMTFVENHFPNFYDSIGYQVRTRKRRATICPACRLI